MHGNYHIVALFIGLKFKPNKPNEKSRLKSSSIYFNFLEFKI